MCRWLGYFGDPILIEELVYNQAHSLIEQSRAARFTSHLTNADGFGIGWYGGEELPGVYRSVSPAWSDRNLQDLCAQIRSPLFLALTFGLDDEPLPALGRMAGTIEATGRRHGVADPLQMTLGVSDGERLYAIRYASGRTEPNTLYVSNDARDVRLLYPEVERLRHLSDEARAVVSEPLADLPGLWREVPPSTALVVQPGAYEQLPFAARE